jgi:hypothetical protein
MLPSLMLESRSSCIFKVVWTLSPWPSSLSLLPQGETNFFNVTSFTSYLIVKQIRFSTLPSASVSLSLIIVSSALTYNQTTTHTSLIMLCLFLCDFIEIENCFGFFPAKYIMLRYKGKIYSETLRYDWCFSIVGIEKEMALFWLWCANVSIWKLCKYLGILMENDNILQTEIIVAFYFQSYLE